jgi:hypothetical protein
MGTNDFCRHAIICQHILLYTPTEYGIQLTMPPDLSETIHSL